MANPTYSFLDVHVSLQGPGVSVSLGAGSGNSKEGITWEFDADRDRMVIGADGSPMHGLSPDKSGKAHIRLLKTSPFNAVLEAAYTYQASSSLFWGQNILVLTNPVSGDDYTATSVAFQRHPRNEYAEDPTMLEWSFNCGVIDAILGSGNQAAAGNVPQ